MKVTRTFRRIIETIKRIVILRGWTWSSKTYSVLQMAFKRLRTWELRKNEYILNWVFTVARQYSAELNKSVLRDFYNIVNEEGFILSSRYEGWNILKENRTEKTFTYKWRTLEFIGCDDVEKIKGARRKILYINEANNVLYKIFMQLLMRTEGPAFLDFNPDDDEVRINTKIEQERTVKIWDVDLIVSTFRDNAFLPPAVVQEVLNYAVLDPDLWKVYWNWEYWKIKGAIFTRWIHWDIIWSIPESSEFKGYWQDYWFTTDPTTLIWIYKYDKDTIILDQVIWETHLVNTYKDDHKKQESITWHYELNNVDQSSEIWADSSEPKSNEEINDSWYNIEWVTKGAWSVVSWLKQMKKYKILITARSLNLINEFKKYVWATDKEWTTLKDKEGRPIPKDAYNQWIDASRYGITHIFEDSSSLEDLELSIL